MRKLYHRSIICPFFLLHQGETWTAWSEPRPSGTPSNVSHCWRTHYHLFASTPSSMLLESKCIVYWGLGYGQEKGGPLENGEMNDVCIWSIMWGFFFMIEKVLETIFFSLFSTLPPPTILSLQHHISGHIRWLQHPGVWHIRLSGASPKHHAYETEVHEVGRAVERHRQGGRYVCGRVWELVVYVRKEGRNREGGGIYVHIKKGCKANIVWVRGS